MAAPAGARVKAGDLKTGDAKSGGINAGHTGKAGASSAHASAGRAGRPRSADRGFGHGGGQLPVLTHTVASARAWLADAVAPSRTGRSLAEPVRRRRQDGAAVARAAVYAPDERQAMLLLLLPFLLMAAAIGINQSVRYAASLPEIAAVPDPARKLPADAARPVDATAPGRLAAAIRATPRVDIPPSVAAPAAAPSPAQGSGAVVTAEVRPGVSAAPVLPATPLGAAPAAGAAPATPGPAPAGLTASAATPAQLPAVLAAPSSAAPIGAPAALAASAGDTLVVAALPEAPPVSAGAISAPVTSASPSVVPEPGVMGSVAAPEGSVLALPPSVLSPPLAGLEQPLDGEGSRRVAFYPPGASCPAPAAGWGAKTASLSPALPASITADGAAFGRELAAAARRQLSEMVVYTDRYRRISYPMGDVAPLYGVCTDVIIRAYRELGLDLQALVHTSRIGSGDTSIDHRRVDTLRRFFAASGQSLPITDFAEDYRPGDVVSYYRPQNAHSHSHIALVADVVGPSGNPMIIHNRGWGPQLEDALFVDEITGHYRYSGPRSAPATPIAPAVAASPPAASGAVRAHAARPAVPVRLRAGKAAPDNGRAVAPPGRRREARSGGIVETR